MKNKNKLVAVMLLFLMFFTNICNVIKAVEINNAKLENGALCTGHLQYKFGTVWANVSGNLIYYNLNNVRYPAYCITSPDVHGVDEEGSYNVSIEKTLDDVRIWRAIINGYPYKSPAQLGVETDEDAYMATKQAIYSIMFNRDVLNQYRGIDDRGAKMVNAMNNLVNIGRHGTETPQDPSILASKNGELYEEGNFYVQRYSVSSKVDIKSYYITSIANLPKDSIIVNSSGNQTDNFNGNEDFFVKIPKNSMNKDINLIVNLQGKCRNYPIFFGKSPNPNWQDYAVTFDPFGDGVGRALLNIKTNTGKIKINKTDDETSAPIQNVKFKLFKDNGEIVGEVITDENGEATFSSLYQGKYILKEVETDEKYILNESEIQVNVFFDKTTVVNIENEHKKGNIKVYKVDADNNRLVLGNVEFKLFSHEFKKFIGTYYTNADGEIEIKKLRIGEYSLYETNTNKWYNLSENTDVKVEWNSTKELKIENELKKGNVKIIKVDSDNNEIRLSGVKFDVLDNNNNILETLITDENGEAVTSKYPLRDFPQITIRERETLKNYVLNEQAQTITLENNETINVIFENKKIKGNILLNKIDSEFQNKFLTGAKFDVYKDVNNNGEYDEQDIFISNLKETEIGVYKLDNIEYGVYFIKETEAPENYLLDEEYHKIEILEDGVTYEVENEIGKGFANTVVNGKLKIQKRSEDGTLNGFTFKVIGTDIRGNTFSKEYVTDKNGEILIENIPVGEYTVFEMENKATKKYIIPESQNIKIENGKETNISFFNKLIEIPDTGDISKLGIMSLIFIVSLIGIVIVLLNKRKK